VLLCCWYDEMKPALAIDNSTQFKFIIKQSAKAGIDTTEWIVQYTIKQTQLLKQTHTINQAPQYKKSVTIKQIIYDNI